MKRKLRVKNEGRKKEGALLAPAATGGASGLASRLSQTARAEARRESRPTSHKKTRGACSVLRKGSIRFAALTSHFSPLTLPTPSLRRFHD